MFRGSIVALATPFNQQGEVDYHNLSELIQWHIESGTDAIVLCGTTGEAPTLTHEETIRIFKEGVIAAKGRIPIIAGTGTYDTRKAVQLTQEAKVVGADGSLIVVPYYTRPTAEGCFQHFEALSKVGIPMIVYHHPGRTGIKLPVKAMARIASLPNIVGIKDATGDLDYALDLMHQIKTPVLSGDDTLVIPLMASGAVGDISIVANIIPREWKILTTLLLADQVEEAREFFSRYYGLVKSMVLETNPQCVKFALGAMGKCSSRMRLPLVEPQDDVKKQILNEMVKAGLLLQRKEALEGAVN
ncbi:MAG: 4-hydroxy-tetrahydrodipicolinate synthase [Verrucomicrobia bacterium]|nr:4-hydroxy-tetrahydrodipicolinate synthase [Verrucomicrobiota bacterium]